MSQSRILNTHMETRKLVEFLLNLLMVKEKKENGIETSFYEKIF